MQLSSSVVNSKHIYSWPHLNQIFLFQWNVFSVFSYAMMWSVSLFIFNFYGAALLSSTEDAGAEAYVFALPIGHILGCLLVVFSRT